MFEEDNYQVNSLSGGLRTTLEQYTLKTFGMMALGLLVTTITAILLSKVQITVDGYRGPLALMMCYKFNYLPIVLAVAEIGVVIAFSARLFKASITTVRAMFFTYAVLTGFTFSTLQYLYDSTTIYLAFAITCIYFGALCVIGYTTKMNLARIRPLLLVGLICLIVFNVAAIFMDLSGLERIVCSLGLIIFTGLTAYDAKKMKELYIQYQDDESMLPRLSMYSALDLYLDFINIFLYIIRILGNNKN